MATDLISDLLVRIAASLKDEDLESDPQTEQLLRLALDLVDPLPDELPPELVERLMGIESKADRFHQAMQDLGIPADQEAMQGLAESMIRAGLLGDLKKHDFNISAGKPASKMHGWISPEGEYHHMHPDVAHEEWIAERMGAKNTGPETDDGGGYHNSPHRQKALDLGWASVGHGGSQSAEGNHLNNPRHPATRKLRQMIGEHADHNKPLELHIHGNDHYVEPHTYAKTGAMLDHRTGQRITKSEDLDKGANGDWQKEGYTLKHRKTIFNEFMHSNPKDTAVTHVITAHNKAGKQVGVGYFVHSDQSYESPSHSDKHIVPRNIAVDEKDRRKGLGLAMRNLAESKSGRLMETPKKTEMAPGSSPFWSKSHKKLGKSEALEKALSSDEMKQQGYTIHHLTTAKGHLAGIKLKHNKKVIGHLHYGPHANTEGYHRVLNGHVEEGHRGKGLYQSMIMAARDKVKAQGSKGVMSEGYQRSRDATNAWSKIATHSKDSGYPTHQGIKQADGSYKDELVHTPQIDYFIKSELLAKEQYKQWEENPVHGMITPEGEYRHMGRNDKHPGVGTGGWISVGHAGYNNASGDRETLENHRHPATMKLRELAGKHWAGTHMGIRYSDEPHTPDVSVSADHFSRHGLKGALNAERLGKAQDFKERTSHTIQSLKEKKDSGREARPHSSLFTTGKKPSSTLQGAKPHTVYSFGSHWPVVRLSSEKKAAYLNTHKYGGKTGDLTKEVRKQIGKHLPGYKIIEVNHPNYLKTAELMSGPEHKIVSHLKEASTKHPDKDQRSKAAHAHEWLSKLSKAKPDKRMAGIGWDEKANEEKMLGRLHGALKTLGLHRQDPEGSKRMGRGDPTAVTHTEGEAPPVQQVLHEAAHAVQAPVGDTLSSYQARIGKPGLHHAPDKNVHGGLRPEPVAQGAEAMISRMAGIKPFRKPETAKEGTRIPKEHKEGQRAVHDRREGITAVDKETGMTVEGKGSHALINLRSRGQEGKTEAIHRMKEKNKPAATPARPGSPEEFFGKATVCTAPDDRAHQNVWAQGHDQVNELQDSSLEPHVWAPEERERKKTAELNDVIPVRKSYAQMKDIEKNNNLEKMGAMKRLAPFNPNKDVPPVQRDKLRDWVNSSSEGEGKPNTRNQIGEAPTSLKTRIFHKLHGSTVTRVNKKTGKREFLLHRGMGHEEHKAAMASERHYSNPEHSSWSTDRKVAREFAGQWRGHPANETLSSNERTVSAWIPESHISHMPLMAGSDSNSGAKHKIRALESPYHEEKEVVVMPGKYPVHSGPMPASRDVNTRITQRAQLNAKNPGSNIINLRHTLKGPAK
jgi:hypothetical protein